MDLLLVLGLYAAFFAGVLWFAFLLIRAACMSAIKSAGTTCPACRARAAGNGYGG